MKYISIPSRPRFVVGAFVFILSVFMSIIQSVNVSALTVDPRATAHPTLTPIGVQPTSITLGSAVDFSCPSGVPAGFGTVTPSTDWLYACSACLPTGTAVDLSTSTPGVTHTPVFGGTPEPCQTSAVGGEDCNFPTGTPSATGTPVGTGTPVSTVLPSLPCTSSSQGWTCSDELGGVSLIPHHGTTWQASAAYAEVTIGGSGPAYLTILGTRYHHNTSNNFGASSPWFLHNLTELNSQPISANTWVGSRLVTNPDGFVYAEITHEYDYFLPITLPYTFTIYDGVGNDRGDYFSVSSTFKITILGGVYPTPTPIVTLDPSFCGSVSSSNVPNQFNLGGTGGIIRQSCMSSPEISYASMIASLVPAFVPLTYTNWFSSVFPSEIVFDGVTFCVRERDYSLYIFGFRMPIEAIFGLVLFLSGIRFFVPTVFSGASVLGQNVPTVSQTHSVTTTKTVGSVRVSDTKTTHKKG